MRVWPLAVLQRNRARRHDVRRAAWSTSSRGALAWSRYAKEDLQVLDTWHTLGLRGTGSHDAVADEVFVPADRVFSLFDGPSPGPAALSLPGVRVLRAVDGRPARTARGVSVEACETACRPAATHAARTSADVVRDTHDLAGGSAIYHSAPLQRRFRDAYTATAHFQVNEASRQLPGRIPLDRPADVSML